MRRKSSSRALSTFSRRELGSRGSQLPPCCSGLWRFIFVIPRAQGQYIRRTNLDIIIKVTSNILDEPTCDLHRKLHYANFVPSPTYYLDQLGAYLQSPIYYMDQLGAYLQSILWYISCREHRNPERMRSSVLPHGSPR